MKNCKVEERDREEIKEINIMNLLRSWFAVGHRKKINVSPSTHVHTYSVFLLTPQNAVFYLRLKEGMKKN